MSKSKKSEKDEKKVGFYEKMKTDKRYNAKVQFIGYGVFILLIIIFLNVNGVSNGNISNTINDSVINNINDNEEVQEDNNSLLEIIDNNYSYDINISCMKGEEEFNYRYYGKSYDKNIEINKEIDSVVSTYYEVDGYYYGLNENGEYGLLKSDVIYDLVDYKYIELDEVISLIRKANLNHVLNSSNGNKEEVYNLLVRDLVISNKSDDVIVINVIEEDGKLSIDIDYSNLLKVFDSSISSCKVSYVYTDIGSVLEFNMENGE